MRLLADLTGKRYGELLVVKYSHKDAHSKHHWVSKCDCGNQSIVRASNLTNGNTTSCGDKLIHTYLADETIENLDNRIRKIESLLRRLVAKRNRKLKEL